jgi:hypothetical protein
MSDGFDQYQFGESGELKEPEKDDSVEQDLNDFGDEKPWYETKGGYRRDVISSLLQKAVRRSDEEVAAWAAWELARSGFTTNLWNRLQLFVVEDLMAGHEVALLVEQYETLATERWEPDSWQGRLCAIHAALACARAPSSRESTYANDYFDKLRQDRARAEQEEDYEMMYEQVVPEDELEPGGKYDVALDKHTYPGSGMGRGWRHFRVHGARCGPNEDTDVGRKFRRRMMEYDSLGYRDGTMNFSEAEIEHALTPPDSDSKWGEPETLRDHSLEDDSE